MTQTPLRRVACALVLLAAACAPAQEMPAEPFAAQGQFEDGTNYRVVVPADWNGTLVLDLDFANRLDVEPGLVEQWMVENGYAIGGISREPVAYQFRQAVDYLLAVRRMVVDGRGQPARTITWGNSRGGFVSRLAIEWEPEVFDGALMSSGGGAGEVGTFNSKLDALWTLNVLTGADLKLVSFTDRDEAMAANAALGALLDRLTVTPEGRARLALAAAFEQFPRWTDADVAPPAADAYEAQLDQIAGGFGFGNPAQVRWGVEVVAGGNFSWNHGVDYAALLDRSGMRDLVDALYATAGLDLADDLAALADAPRLGADPRVLAAAESLTSYTGQVAGPVMIVDNPADPVDADAFKLAYQRTLEEAGNGELIRTSWVQSAGHSSHSSLERLTGFVTLIERLDTGSWPDTSPGAMQVRAEALQGATTLELGAVRFIDHAPPEMLRPWDGSDWGTYQPCAGLDAATSRCP